MRHRTIDVESLRLAQASRNYRQSHGTFARYCRSVHGISVRTAYDHLSNYSRLGRKTPIPTALRWAIWERDNFTCAYCGARRFLAVDHIIPETRGGGQSPGNLITTCKSCNSRKGAKCKN